MSAPLRTEVLRFGAIVAAVALLVTGPGFVSKGLPTIKEDLFVSDTANGQLYVLRTKWKGTKAASTDLLGVITQGLKQPTDLAVGDGVAVVIDQGKNLVIFDTNTLEKIGQVKVGKKARFVAITPDGATALVTQGKKNVKVVDVASQKVTGKAKGGKNPWQIEIDDLGEVGLVANVGNNTISVLDIDVLTSRSARAPGVTVLKKGICDLSGGVSIARVTFGTFGIWSCGADPSKSGPRPARSRTLVPPGQIGKINDPNPKTPPSPLSIPDTDDGTGGLWPNTHCKGDKELDPSGGDFGDDGQNGNEPLETDSGRIGAGTQAFNYNFFTNKKTILGAGALVNPFALVNGNQLTLLHPRGALLAKTRVLTGPENAELAAVESTLTGIPEICSR